MAPTRGSSGQHTRRTRLTRRAFLAAGVVAVLSQPTSVLAQSGRPPLVLPPSAALHRVVVPVTAHAPVIDGKLDPQEWAGAMVVDGFTQMDPVDGAPMTERTEVLIVRDAEQLYVAFVAHDAEMKRVRAELTRRDAFSQDADAVGIAIDPYRSGSHGSHFLFNPLGAQSDAAGGGSPDFTWDGVLGSRGQLLDDRYIVEVAIPFATLLTGGHPREEWDVNFFRQIPHRGEQGWWTRIPQGDQLHMFEHMGRLAGLGDVASRTRFELIPTVTGQAHRDGVARSEESSWGATARLPLSPTLRVEGTYRPDFSAVESDEPQVGFNERFALFYPEKRPFFLEAASRFETPGSSFVSDPLQLLHTRTLVRPRVGGRLLATPQGGFLGAMVVTDERPDGTVSGNAAVLRAKLERSGGVQAGVLATRYASEGHRNGVAAVDAQLRLPHAATLTLQFARSATTTDSLHATSQGSAAYADLSRETGRDFEQVVYRRVERDFATDLGFVPRSDFQQIVGHAGFYVRPAHGALIRVSPMMQYVLSLDQAGSRLETEYFPHVEFTFGRQTRAHLGYRFGDEIFREREYQQGRAELKLWTTPTPALSFAGVAKHGRRVRYDLEGDVVDQTFVSDYDELNSVIEVRPTRAAAVSLTGVWRRLSASAEIPARQVWLGRAQGLYHMSSTSFVRVITQYDPDDHSRQGSMLLGREISYGTQFHVGANYLRRDPGAAPAAGRVETSVFVRLSYLMRH